ncbi:MAG: hypothetical protein AAGH89_03690, partial [Verrucomicrobiota bacterium]
MKTLLRLTVACLTGLLMGGSAASEADGNGDVEISGELKEWHKVTLTLDGPFARETDTDPNPFTERKMNVQ